MKIECLIYYIQYINHNFTNEQNLKFCIEWEIMREESGVSTSTVTVSTQLPSTHSWNESTPTNQSGLGLIRAMTLTTLWFPSRKALATLLPSPCGTGGPVKAFSMFGESPPVSRPSVLPVSTYCVAPVVNLSPRRYREYVGSCVRPEITKGKTNR